LAPFHKLPIEYQNGVVAYIALEDKEAPAIRNSGPANGPRACKSRHAVHGRKAREVKQELRAQRVKLPRRAGAVTCVAAREIGARAGVTPVVGQNLP